MQSRRSLKAEINNLKIENTELKAKITELTKLKDEIKYITRLTVAHEIGSKVMKLEKENRELKSKKWRKEYLKVVAKLEKIVNKNKEAF